ncbi:MAG: hypothetical protein JW943_01385 [Deltaproteobacteria bacterium]|nr:hypothetical protein [Deltaproteobacteria bacterium]
MSVIFYRRFENSEGGRLEDAIETAISKRTIERHRSLLSLSTRLHRPVFDASVAVLCAASKKDMDGILGLRDVLRDIKLILVLPDDDPETLAQAHTLMPRYVAWNDADYKNVGRVLKRLVDLHDNAQCVDA